VSHPDHLRGQPPRRFAEGEPAWVCRGVGAWCEGVGVGVRACRGCESRVGRGSCGSGPRGAGVGVAVGRVVCRWVASWGLMG
jgi:hypothetical protein